MGKFFSRFKKDPVDPGVSSLGNMANFYSLLIFLIAIPFVLIIALVWVTGILGFNAYIFEGSPACWPISSGASIAAGGSSRPRWRPRPATSRT